MVERFLRAIATVEPKKHGRVTAVAKATGYSKAMISAVFTGREPLHDKLLNAVCSAYGINREWVRTGSGEMLSNLNINAANNQIANKKALDVLLRAKKFRDELDAMIEEFESDDYPVELLTSDAEMEEIHQELDLEMIIDCPVAVTKGSIRTLPVLHHTDENNETASWDGVEKISCPYGIAPEGSFAVRISGDSMSPKYEHGDVVIADPYRCNNPGMPVVARLKDGRLLVKRIRFAGDLVFLESIHPNPKYEPVVIPKDQIEAQFRIAWVYSPEPDERHTATSPIA